MNTLYISLKHVDPDWIELRYFHSLPPKTYNPRRLKLAEVHQWIDQGRLSSHIVRPDLRRVGEKLFCWLDGDDKLLSREINQCPASGLVLAITAEEGLGQLPWEVLHDGKEFLVERGCPIFPIRWIEHGTRTNRPAVKSHLQMVLMAASPQNVEPVLDFEKEEAQILEITKILPLSLRVEESGCVEEFGRVWQRLAENTYEVFHLIARASSGNNKPYLITEGLSGEPKWVTSEELVKSFGNRFPHLVFLSGRRTGEGVEGRAMSSIAETLVRKGVPAVVCCNGTVLESTATLAARYFYESLAKGYSIAEAVRNSCLELWKEKKSEWHLMRLFAQSEAWGPLVSEPGDYVAEDVPVQYKFLDVTNKVRVATAEEFVGRRRLLQDCLRELRSRERMGILLHGLGGVGKSTVAARLVERLASNGYVPIIIHGQLNVEELQRLLASKCQSESGLGILNGSLPLAQKLTRFLDGDISPSRRFCFVLDDFEASLEAGGDGAQVLPSSAIEPLTALVRSIGNSRHGHRMIITSRYDVKLPDIGGESLLCRKQVAALRGVDLKKKCSRLKAFRKNSGVEPGLQRMGIEIADGNPRLLEWLDKVLLEAELEKDQILTKMREKETSFRENILAEELLNRQRDVLVNMLSRLQIFRLPVPKGAVSAVCDDIIDLEEHERRAVELGLLEVSEFQGRMSYRVPQILSKLIPHADEVELVQKAANALYEAWGLPGGLRCEEQVVEIYRLGEMAGNEEICIRSGTRLYKLWDCKGRYREALSLCSNILERRKRVLGNDHEDVARNVGDLSRLNLAQGRYRDAESLCKQCLEMLKRVLGEEGPDVANCLRDLGGVYRKQGRYKDAERLYEQCLEMDKRLLGEVHPSVATSLHGLAGVYKEQGRYWDAARLYEQCLEMDKRLLGEEHPSVATSVHGLAGVYKEQGRYRDAEKLYEQCLEKEKRLFGEEHPSVAISMNGLAGVYKEQGRYRDAERLYEYCLEMKKRLFGEEHPSVTTSLHGLAGVYKEQGRYRDAERLYEHCLEMAKRQSEAPECGLQSE